MTGMAENAFQELDLLLERLCDGLLEEEQHAGKRLVRLLEGSQSLPSSLFGNAGIAHRTFDGARMRKRSARNAGHVGPDDFSPCR